MPTHVVVWFDEPQVARLISCRLMRADFEVHSVHDAETAWEALDRVQPQLLVTNWTPDRAELLHKASAEHISVIALTPIGRSLNEVNELCRRGLVSAVLSLPCSLRRLVDLARHITQHEPRCLLAEH